MRKVEETPSQRESGVMERPLSRRRASGTPRAVPRRAQRTGERDGDWRCLEWGQGSGERRPRRDSKVTIVQLSRGELLRQDGPDTWLPEAGDFVHRMAQLLARGLGFERCRSLCLRAEGAVLTVADAAGTKVVAVSGPSRSMTNVLRRAGLQ